MQHSETLVLLELRDVFAISKIVETRDQYRNDQKIELRCRSGIRIVEDNQFHRKSGNPFDTYSIIFNRSKTISLNVFDLYSHFAVHRIHPIPINFEFHFFGRC